MNELLSVSNKLLLSVEVVLTLFVLLLSLMVASGGLRFGKYIVTCKYYITDGYDGTND